MLMGMDWTVFFYAVKRGFTRPMLIVLANFFISVGCVIIAYTDSCDDKKFTLSVVRILRSPCVSQVPFQTIVTPQTIQNVSVSLDFAMANSGHWCQRLYGIVQGKRNLQVSTVLLHWLGLAPLSFLVPGSQPWWLVIHDCVSAQLYEPSYIQSIF